MPPFMPQPQERTAPCTPELWGGLECSLNRVGDLYLDQLEYSGHYERGREDIARFAGLGIQSLRYPVLWERHERLPETWTWTDGQLSALQEHQLTPIIELVHHGSGPPHCSLLSAGFANGLEKFARQVAERYPWIQHYTPINEPLTTARFSGLYGFWYPHQRDDRSFLRALINQLKASVLAMRAIRQVNPNAAFIQTEDLAKTYSTPLLTYQADFENERRWLTYDLLCGRFTEHHALWKYFLNNGIAKHELYFFLENPCAPDMLGLDHYCVSERYLDENIDVYPARFRGGNGRHAYADVPAINVRHNHTSGLALLLTECWARYGKPMAITEVFLDGDSGDQIRWLSDVWNIAMQCGLPVKAVTVWSLLGSYGWRDLLQFPSTDYEPGPFSIFNGQPEPTALAHFVQQLSANPLAHHPALDSTGWWKDSKRFYWESKPTYATHASIKTNLY